MHCLICQQVVECGKLNFWGEAICSGCEAQLMESTVDQPEYDCIVQAFRQLWQQKLLLVRDHHYQESDGV